MRKINLAGFYYQKLEEYLLNDLHKINCALKFRIEKMTDRFKITFWTEFPSNRSLKRYKISYSIANCDTLHLHFL